MIRRCAPFVFFALLAFACEVKAPPAWPESTATSRPWTRWWWHGSAVSKEGITAELESMQSVGIGGVEITPIYGVKGFEEQFVPYLSPKWVELLAHTLAESKRLGLGVDMATGTGWPFGGPWVQDVDAAKNMHHEYYMLNGGERLPSPVQYQQPPYIRGVRITPDIKSLKQPISSNDNLQLLAIDQVQFARQLPLVVLVATGPHGEKIDLLDRVDANGRVDWVAPAGRWRIDALFQGWHGKMVERAGPGGEGWVIDHFSDEALKNYLAHFDSSFGNTDLSSLRAFFNDSYEVDDARGAADWTPNFLDEFKNRMGYDLRNHLPELFASKPNDTTRRVLHDYRLVVSQLVLEKFTLPWTTWANKHHAITRNQAHGSPANILDLYATVGIPEIEGTEPLRIKMASSVANVMGKNLVSSESATWLDEHFLSSLGDIKSAVDLFWLNGVNHVFYHGTAYSPRGEAWPGWLFYAAVHLNDRNPQWTDFHALNKYVERTQSMLQNSVAAHDVLLYYPIADPLSTPTSKMVEHFDGIGTAFKGSSFEEAATVMANEGFTFDYISDHQLMQVAANAKRLRVPSGRDYQVIVVPDVQFMPEQTLAQLLTLAKAGATVVFYQGLPNAPAGYRGLDAGPFRSLVEQLPDAPENGVTVSKRLPGEVLVGDNLKMMLESSGVQREPMVDRGIAFERRDAGRRVYLVKNTSAYRVTEIPFEAQGTTVVRFDPMDGSITRLRSRETSTTTFVDVHLEPGEVAIITFESTTYEQLAPFQAIDLGKQAFEVTGPWQVQFETGGPTLPVSLHLDSLGSWTRYGSDYESFSGTAVYRTHFKAPDGTEAWWLDLGDVGESAQVLVNGHDLGTVFSSPFRVRFEPSMAQADNLLEVRVTNGMANRIIALDRGQVGWKKFYNINFPSRKPANATGGLFNAANWRPIPSGLFGPVRLLPLHAAPARRSVPLMR